MSRPNSKITTDDDDDDVPQCVVWRDPSHANTRPIYQSAPATQATALSPVVTPLLKRDPTPPFSSQTLHLLFFQARVRAARCL